MRDYYAVLQVRPDADAEVIAAAYRSLARKYHPDHTHDDTGLQRMRELNEAFATLSDPVRRREYDAYRLRRLAAAVPPAPAARSPTTEEMRRTPRPTPVEPVTHVPLPARARAGRSARPVVLSVMWVACLAGAVAATWAVWKAETNAPPPLPTPRLSSPGTPPPATPLLLPSRATTLPATAPAEP